MHRRWLHRNVQKQANACWILTPLLLPEMLPKLHPPGVSAQRKTAANENPPTAQSATWLLPGPEGKDQNGCGDGNLEALQKCSRFLWKMLFPAKRLRWPSSAARAPAMSTTSGKVLHEEHIELLMEEFAFLKREVLGKELLKGSLLFTAGPLEEGQFGFPAFSGISRLTWLVSLFGELSLVSATLEEQKEKQYMKMTVHLETKDKCPLSWIEEKGPGFQRNRYLSFHFKSGSLENRPNVGVNKNIFLKDQDLFVQKLLGQVSEKELAAERKRVLHCLALADAVQRCCRAEK
ncbi:biliverdin reductase A-like isoform X1 [Dipodomys merriami]|uniref:biliverdin reductase A-like isoform X1 n=1 Tax=Dipodomys merriami TaxID=94247 RepID=UPI00384F1954